MAYNNTYVALDKVTVGTTTATVSLTSINQGYTDLVLVIAGRSTRSASSDDTRLVINSDSGSNYSNTHIYGEGSTAGSDRFTNSTWGNAGFWIPAASTTSGIYGITTVSFQNYSNSTTYKTWLVNDKNSSNLSGLPGASVGLWRSTAAISRLDISLGTGSWAAGTTFSLYGIAATGSNPTAKATGGTISYSSDGYTYHTFTSSGTFTPSTSLTADCLVVAGGGGGGQARGGGGGAGGFLGFSSQSLTATGYTVTVGAGGGNKTTGSDSQFGALTLVKGGGFGGSESGYGTITGGNGGSGGGGSFGQAGGTATSGQGYAGGGNTGGFDYQASGGGGAGAVGFNGDFGGAGGVGLNTYSSWGVATNVGQNVNGSYYFAGGGGSSSNRVGTAGATGGYGGGATGADGNGGAGNNGTANTGGGGGGGSGNPRSNGGSGGSGVVIIRYASV